jgi:hypothetical protein
MIFVPPVTPGLEAGVVEKRLRAYDHARRKQSKLHGAPPDTAFIPLAPLGARSASLKRKAEVEVVAGLSEARIVTEGEAQRGEAAKVDREERGEKGASSGLN